MTNGLYWKCLPGIVAAGFFGAAETQASIVQLQAPVAAQTLIAATGNSAASAITPINSSFAQFNPALGTLTGVSFNYDYELQIVLAGTAGGSGGSAAGPVSFNGVTSPLVIAGGSGGAGPATIPFSESGTYTVTGDLSTFTGTGSNLFSWQANDSVSPGGSPDFTAELDLLSSSSVGVTYTYTAAVPEPAGIGAIAVGSMAIIARRKRK